MTKFPHTGIPKYFAPYLSSYSTWSSQIGGNFLVVPKFYPSTPKSVAQLDYRFVFHAEHAPIVWNALPDDSSASPSLAPSRKQLKKSLYTKAYQPQS